MAVDTQQMETGDGGGFFSNRRNLLLAAVAVGGVAGLFFLMRGSGGGSGESTATYSAQDLTLGSIAQQILQFRGESSIGFNNLAGKMDEQLAAQTDLKNAMLGGSESILSALSNLSDSVAGNQAALMQTLQQMGLQLNVLRDDVGGVSFQIRDVNQQTQRVLSQVEVGQWISSQGNQDNLMSIFNLARAIDPNVSWDQIMQGVVGSSYNSPALVGAGGYRQVDMTRDATFDYDGVSDAWADLMSNGPVRYLR